MATTHVFWRARLHQVLETSRRRGDSAHPLDEIQTHPFKSQEILRVPLNPENRVVRAHTFAIGLEGLDAQAKPAVQPGRFLDACNNSRLRGDDPNLGWAIRQGKRLDRQVSRFEI